MNVSNVALIVAAGRGSRAGKGAPKQYRQLAGEMVLTRTIRAFLENKKIDAVSCVIHEDDQEMYHTSVAGFHSGKLLPVTFGGKTRQDSVRLGLEFLAHYKPDKVLIHDAARPLVSEKTIRQVVAKISPDTGCIAAIAVTDTLKNVGGAAEIVSTVDRAGLWRAQTPQGFPFAAIRAAHRTQVDHKHTDDAAVANAAGLPVIVIADSSQNIKITRAEDFIMAEALVAAKMHPRIGQGFDVHAFESGDAVVLCGVKIPHDKKLAGHSDADVGLHALTDALLGAVAAGDIGTHFPPSDVKWKGAASEVFLREAANQVALAGGKIDHCDVTLICEAPKIGPYRDQMRGFIAKVLELPIGCVSVKATTTEGLGFTGRGEGIAAMATATVSVEK